MARVVPLRLLLTALTLWLWPEPPLAANEAEQAASPDKTAAAPLETAANVKLAKELTRQLGSDIYTERVRAKERLMRLGRPAIEPLETAAQSEDCEIRRSAIEILIALRGYGFLGIELHPINEEGQGFGAQASSGVQTGNVLNPNNCRPKGAPRPYPAEIAGLMPGDKIIAINGRLMHSPASMIREISAIGPARIASLEIERDGKPIRLPILLTRKPAAMIRNIPDLEQDPDPPPPVDLEKEATAKPQPVDKLPALPATVDSNKEAKSESRP